MHEFRPRLVAVTHSAVEGDAPPGGHDAPPGGRGLRARKKRETAVRLHAAAIRLAAERGPAHVTVEQIATAAGVSPRTFFNYFPTKEMAITGTAPELLDELENALARRPPAEDPWASLEAVLTDRLEGQEARPELRRLRRRLMNEHPELLAGMHGVTLEAQERLAQAIGRRLGVDADGDPYPRLVVSVAFAVVRAVVAHRAARSADSQEATLRADLADGFAAVAGGLAAPRRADPPDGQQL